MFNYDNKGLRTIFIGKNEDNMYDMLNHLKKNNLDVSIMVSSRSSNPDFAHLEPKYPMYYIKSHVCEHEEALNEGIAYASAKHFDEIICAYPNLEFDTIGNIRARENGITK